MQGGSTWRSAAVWYISKVSGVPRSHLAPLDRSSGHPTVDTIILRNSTGGDIPTGFRLGDLFRQKSLRTAVSGFCYSSCSRMFLGGKRRFFTDDFPPDLTNVGFHGHYDRTGHLEPKLVENRPRAVDHQHSDRNALRVVGWPVRCAVALADRMREPLGSTVQTLCGR